MSDGTGSPPLPRRPRPSPGSLGGPAAPHDSRTSPRSRSSEARRLQAGARRSPRSTTSSPAGHVSTGRGDGSAQPSSCDHPHSHPDREVDDVDETLDRSASPSAFAKERGSVAAPDARPAAPSGSPSRTRSIPAALDDLRLLFEAAPSCRLELAKQRTILGAINEVYDRGPSSTDALVIARRASVWNLLRGAELLTPETRNYFFFYRPGSSQSPYQHRLRHARVWLAVQSVKRALFHHPTASLPLHPSRIFSEDERRTLLALAEEVIHDPKSEPRSLERALKRVVKELATATVSSTNGS